MGHVGCETRSLGQIYVCLFALVRSWMSSKMLGRKLGNKIKCLKNYVLSRGHIFCPILYKFGSTVFLNDILNEFGNGSFQVKN